MNNIIITPLYDILSLLAITCGSPAPPHNGFIVSALSSYAFGQQVSFQCNEGNQLVGEPSAICVALDMWSSPAPTCQGTKLYYQYIIVGHDAMSNERGHWFYCAKVCFAFLNFCNFNMYFTN